jgi:hypothetical protein
MTRRRGSAVVAALLALGASGATEAAAYNVYCTGRVEVEMRSPEQMRSARGSGVCHLAGFDSLSSAEDFARQNLGGAGASCTCAESGAGSEYGVYCAESRVEIDTRSLDQMVSARGSDTCRLSGFDSLSSAESFAGNFGGEDAECTCGD